MTKDTKISLFLVKRKIIKTDIVRYNIFPGSVSIEMLSVKIYTVVQK